MLGLHHDGGSLIAFCVVCACVVCSVGWWLRRLPPRHPQLLVLLSGDLGGGLAAGAALLDREWPGSGERYRRRGAFLASVAEHSRCRVPLALVLVHANPWMGVEALAHARLDFSLPSGLLQVVRTNGISSVTRGLVLQAVGAWQAFVALDRRGLGFLCPTDLGNPELTSALGRRW